MEIKTLEDYLKCVTLVYKKVNKRDSIPAENLVEHINEWEENKHKKIIYNEATCVMEIK